jgi:MinD-like ATPase involved in chromosome partitioning or flagellar assembly
MTFDDIISNVVTLCEGHPGFAALARACLVHDLAGRVHLVVEPGAAAPSCDLEALAELLARRLGLYFAGPILSTAGPREERRVAHAILEQSTEWPRMWDTSTGDPITGIPVPRGKNWRALQRLVSKQAWLSAQPVDPPWPLAAANPAVVSFYSFKGGVGRTTLLAAAARTLAARGHRVVAVDLDLEAPGLGTFLGVETERGVLDFVVDYLITGIPDLARCTGAARALGDDIGSRVEVIPAGRLGWMFVEKLGRLDFATGGLESSESPVGAALQALLEAVRNQLKPDYILIDSRAGLHDLGGLSLHALAHVDVLVARATRQNLLGLEIALQAIGRRKSPEALRRLLVAHTFAPRREERDSPTSEEVDFRQQVHELFGAHIYAEDAAEARDADDAPHFPRPIFQHADLERTSTLEAVPAEILDGDDFRRLCDRLVELCEPELREDPDPDAPAERAAPAGGDAAP